MAIAHTSSHQGTTLTTYLLKKANTDFPSQQEEVGLKYPEWNPSQTVWLERVTITCQPAQHTNPKEEQRPREGPCQKGQHLN